MVQIILILILIWASLILMEFLAVELSAISEVYESKKENQIYTVNTITSICGNQNSQNYTLSHKIGKFQLRGWENSTAVADMKMFLEVYDTNGTLVANSKESDIELVTQKGLPIDNKKINFYLSCTNSTNSNLLFPIKETITINKDELSFSDPIISFYSDVILNDPDLKAERIVQGLDFPTSMAFLGLNDILVLEKDKGTVQRIVNGQILEKPLLDVNVSGFGEGGLVGIAVKKDPKVNSTTYVYLYFTESGNGDILSKNISLGNRLYRYEFANNQLINPRLMLDLPHGNLGIHDGGKIMVGPDNNVYVTVGDVGRGHWAPNIDNKAQNNKTGQDPDGTGGILRFTPDGEPVGNGILGSPFPLNLYYAYGIRNSFGMDFDPVTGKLWDTENGDFNGDEINLVEPGFNSGWAIVEGMSYLQQKFDPNTLVDFNGKGNYSDPEFNWYENDSTAVGPTALKFIKSDKYGKKYENDMLIGDFNHGHIYRFDLNNNRTDLSLKGSLADKMTTGDDYDLDVILAQAPGAIIDIEVGPEGYIYIVSLNVRHSDCDNEYPACRVNGGIKGEIFRIVPKD
jgi:aldose sugar dehydrogenase